MALAATFHYHQFEKSNQQNIVDDNSTVNWPNSGKTSTVTSNSEIINLNDAHNLVISNKSIVNAKDDCIKLTNCSNIHITACKFLNGSKRGIYLYNCHNIIIDFCSFSNTVTGVLADHCQGGIAVNHNQFLNMVGPVPAGQYVQFNTVNGAGLSISYNKGENIFGKGKPEDCINLYKSNGTAESPIKVIGNWIRGGGPSGSGGGIMLGDNGGSYQIARDNILVDPGEYGMAIAGGSNISMINNIVYGKSQPFTNVGLYVDAIGGYPVSHATVKGNRINFYNAANYNNNCWLEGKTEKPDGWDNGNIWGDKTLNEHILPATIIKMR